MAIIPRPDGMAGVTERRVVKLSHVETVQGNNDDEGRCPTEGLSKKEDRSSVL
jgi:hypothetical protein